MTSRTYALVTATLFSWIAILHAIRLVRAWEMTIGGTVIPVWLSWIGLIVSGYLAYAGLRLGRSKPV